MKRTCSVLLLLLAGSCVGGATPAEIATYDAIAPEYASYVQADMALSTEQKQRRFNTIETWRLRVGVSK
jgi:hypothetical protein